jgi:hypothetical protein
MTTRAVTSADSASANDQETQLLPRDHNYMMTGDLPASEDDGAGQSANEEEDHEHAGAGDGTAGEEHTADTDGSAPSKETTDAAASEAATSQKKTSKTAATSENRYAKLSRENREMREKLARLEGREEGRSSAQPREKQESQPATEKPLKEQPEPQLSDIDPKTNLPKFKTLAEYLSAQRAWDRAQILTEIDSRSAKSQQEQQQSQAEQVIQKRINEGAAEIRKTHADFDDVVASALDIKDELGREAFFYTKGSPIDCFLIDSDRGHDVMYAIGKNPDAHKHIFARDAQGNYKLSAVRQLRELAKIENSLPAKAGAGASGSTHGRTNSSTLPGSPWKCCATSKTL